MRHVPFYFSDSAHDAASWLTEQQGVRICSENMYVCVCVSRSWLPLTSAESCFGWNTAWLTYQWCLLRDESIRAHERLLTARPSFVSSGGCHQSYRRLRSPERLIADHGFLSHPLPPLIPSFSHSVWASAGEAGMTALQGVYMHHWARGERGQGERDTGSERGRSLNDSFSITRNMYI